MKCPRKNTFSTLSRHASSLFFHIMRATTAAPLLYDAETERQEIQQLHEIVGKACNLLYKVANLSININTFLWLFAAKQAGDNREAMPQQQEAPAVIAVPLEAPAERPPEGEGIRHEPSLPRPMRHIL